MHGYITPCKTAKSIIEYSVSIMLKNKDKKLAKAFNFSFRYIDDVLSINNHQYDDYLIYTLLTLILKSTTNED
jgi:hypothetical protein